jgi:hypothetical protein
MQLGAQSIEIEKAAGICPAASALKVGYWAATRLEIDADRDVTAL